MTEGHARPARRRWWPWAGAGIGIGLAALVLWRIDFAELGRVLAGARVEYLALVPAVIALEQLVRAWKWRQILHPLLPVGTLRLFGAIMAGYLGNFLIPFGVSPLLRSWLVARREGLKMSAVLATVAIDRMIDGVVFAILVVLVLAVAVLPDPTGNLRLGLLAGAAVGFTLFAGLLWLLARHKRALTGTAGWVRWVLSRLSPRLAQGSQRLLASFAEGIVWPVNAWRRVAIVLSSVLIKFIAATHPLWAGLAFGVLLEPMDYLVVLAMLGFLVFLTHLARFPGGFIVGAIFALGLFGVGEERALAMVFTMRIGTMVSVAAFGAFSLWRSGLALADLPGRREHLHERT
ncbi:MAG: flippase-like domain-containing protein [SAR324 cluster bacterium]|nr:flippase-like domain-containing protein [SAR324 cluster bacterium]